MRWLSLLRQRLGWKLFLSYLVIILVGAVVLMGTTEFLSAEPNPCDHVGGCS